MMIIYYLFLLTSMVTWLYSVYALLMHYTNKDYIGSEYIKPILEKITFVPEKHRLLVFLIWVSIILSIILNIVASMAIQHTAISDIQQAQQNAMQHFNAVYKTK